MFCCVCVCVCVCCCSCLLLAACCCVALGSTFVAAFLFSLYGDAFVAMGWGTTRVEHFSLSCCCLFFLCIALLFSLIVFCLFLLCSVLLRFVCFMFDVVYVIFF